MKLDLTNFEAVIFDMDGTMIDNMSWHNKAWEKFVSTRGINDYSEEFHKKYFGKRNEHILRDLFGQHLTDEEVESLADEKEAIYRDLYSSDIKGVEGLDVFAKTVRKQGLKLAIATTASRKNREFALKALRLENVFPVIVGAEDVTHGKPDPEIFLKTAEQLNADPEKCLVFEDSSVGVRAGKRAGMTVVAVLTTHTKEELNEADYFIKDFTEIEL